MNRPAAKLSGRQLNAAIAKTGQAWCNAMNEVKSVCYAYASSDTAKKLGFGNTGCWYVKTCIQVDGVDSDETIVYAGSEHTAKYRSTTIDLPYSRYSMFSV
jgi:late competence protein required for DNA uptake (superfamily II DNA/RNA helicase)